MTPIVPGWVKALLGFTIAGAIIYFTPIMDLMAMFFYVCVLPAVLIGCSVLALVGLHQWGWQTFNATWNAGVESFKSKVTEAAVDMQRRQA